MRSASLLLCTAVSVLAFAGAQHSNGGNRQRVMGGPVEDAAHRNLLAQAHELLQRYPLVDTHVDTPQVMRVLSDHPLDMIDAFQSGLPGHFDVKRAQQGGLGGAFFTVWTPCPDQLGLDLGPDYLAPDNTVRDTLESLDLIRETISHSPQLQFATTGQGIDEAFAQGKMAALIGMEGSHMLGNSLSTIRILAALGVRYLTLTHVCHTAFAHSAGGGAGTDGRSLGSRHGLTPLGEDLVRELNRLGVMVDLSHVNDQTMRDVFDMTDVPLVFTHSGARGVHNHPRNVPDEILDRIGYGPGKLDAVVQSVLYPVFIDPANATVARVADHVEYIASKTGSKAHVGLASDFDGMGMTIEGMEDASKWPNLIAEFIRRGWTEQELAGLMGGNLKRIMGKVEEAAAARQGQRASNAVYSQRRDLPANEWGGPGGAYLPPKVKRLVDARRLRDEL